MIDPSTNPSSPAGTATTTDPPGVPMVVDRAVWQAELHALRIGEEGRSHGEDGPVAGSAMTMPEQITNREQWDAASAQLLTREKELTRLEDELAAERRKLPWAVVDKQYTLQTEAGPKSLAELFNGRSQLTVYHFMFGPEYVAGCPTNSSIADCFDPLVPHLKARDVTMICVSRAPLQKLLAYRQRMGWRFNWASSHGSDFSIDFGGSASKEATRAWLDPIADQLPPIAARNAQACGVDLVSYLSEGFSFVTFAREAENVYLTYSTGGRGVEFLMSYYPILDRVPTGRDEGEGFQMWLNRHDEYDSQPSSGRRTGQCRGDETEGGRMTDHQATERESKGRPGRPPDRIRVRRNPKKGRYERATVEAILDRALVAHVAFVDRGEAVCIPMLFARLDGKLSHPRLACQQDDAAARYRSASLRDRHPDAGHRAGTFGVRAHRQLRIGDRLRLLRADRRRRRASRSVGGVHE